jgi:hypothetical protein
MKLRLLVVCAFLLSTIALAQTFRGTVLGTVTDPSGNVVAGAIVKVRNVGTGLERTATTSADGSYAIPELPIGMYSVTVSQSGFQTSVTNGVEVDVATERTRVSRRTATILNANTDRQTLMCRIASPGCLLINFRSKAEACRV